MEQLHADKPHLDTLDADLLACVLNPLPLGDRLACRAASKRLHAAVRAMPDLTLTKKHHLNAPLARCFAAANTLKLVNYEPEHLFQLAAMLAALPSLTSLTLVPADGDAALTDAGAKALSGALAVRACPCLRYVWISGHLTESCAFHVTSNLPADAALLLAVRHGFVHLVNTAIARGASADAAYPNGPSALACASQLDFPESLRALLARGCIVDVPRPTDGATPLLLVAARGRVAPAALLVQARADVNRCSNDGTTPLLAAVAHGSAEMVELLLDAGANVEAAGKGGLRALHLAARRGYTELTRILLAAHADPSCLHLQLRPLILAASKGHASVVAELLGAKADVSAAYADGLTALHVAAKLNNGAECVSLLLGAGADVDARGSVYGTTPLLAAASSGNAAVVALLLRAGASVNVAGRGKGTTPLMQAANALAVDVVRSLLAYDADPTHTCHEGLTAFDYAAQAEIDWQQEHCPERLSEDVPGSLVGLMKLRYWQHSRALCLLAQSSSRFAHISTAIMTSFLFSSNSTIMRQLSASGALAVMPSAGDEVSGAASGARACDALGE